MSAQTFATGEVLTVVTGRLLCDMGRLYAILNHLSGESLMTHQLPRASREAEPILRERFPDLAAIDIPHLDGKEAYEAWLAGIEAEYGATREVEPLAPEDHTSIDPISELRMMRPDAEILVVEVPHD